MNGPIWFRHKQATLRSLASTFWIEHCVKIILTSSEKKRGGISSLTTPSFPATTFKNTYELPLWPVHEVEVEVILCLGDHMDHRPPPLLFGLPEKCSFFHFPPPSSVLLRHSRDLSTFLDNLVVSTVKAIYFLNAYHLGISVIILTTWTTCPAQNSPVQPSTDQYSPVQPSTP